jgi:HlyD family secretion protein
VKKILVLIILLALGGIVYLGLSKKFHSKPKKVEVARVKRERIETAILATGKVEPSLKTIIMAKQGGRIKKVLVEEGDIIKPNQTLLIFNREEAESQIIQAENKLKMAELELKEAWDNLKVTEILYSASATSGLKLREDRIRHEKTIIERDGADEMVKFAKIRLEDLRCVSQIDGVVIERKVEDGQVVENGKELFVIASISRYEVKADVDEMDAVSVVLNQKAIITHEAIPDKEFEAEVIKISPQVKEMPPITVLEVTIGYFKKNPFLKIGMSVDVKIITGYKDGLFLPLKAIRGDEKGRFVFVIKNSLTYKKEIETGVSTLDKIEVLNLKEKDEVIVSPVKEGERVLK